MGIVGLPPVDAESVYAAVELAKEMKADLLKILERKNADK